MCDDETNDAHQQQQLQACCPPHPPTPTHQPINHQHPKPKAQTIFHHQAKMSRQRTLLSIAAMVTVGASAFVLPVRQPVTGPALCARKASASTTARALSMQAVSQDELKKQVGLWVTVWGLGGCVGPRALDRLGRGVDPSDHYYNPVAAAAAPKPPLVLTLRHQTQHTH